MKILHYFAIDKIPAGNIPTNSANAVLNGALNIFYVASGVVAVVVIIIAGYMYVTSQGDSAAVAKAKNAILYAVIGLVVILLAFGVTWFVIGRFV
jgi:cytochrome bd-type quinol oxidase subunit 2